MIGWNDGRMERWKGWIISWIGWWDIWGIGDMMRFFGFWFLGGGGGMGGVEWKGKVDFGYYLVNGCWGGDEVFEYDKIGNDR